MGTFKTKKLLSGNPILISHISQAIEQEFKKNNYEVMIQDLVSGGKEVSITKGGIFKALVGMKTALKIKLIPKEEHIQWDAGVGLWGLQAIPTAITLFVTWPVILTQIWGLVQQSKLDDRVVAIAERVVLNKSQAIQYKYCPIDGSCIPLDSKFCPYCASIV
jgi:hypothetical protein